VVPGADRRSRSEAPALIKGVMYIIPLRIIDQLRPAWVVAENVTHLDNLALEQVVSDLEAHHYQVAPPLEVPACAFGFDHWRPRLWILGHANGDGQSGLPVDAEVAGLSRDRDDAGSMGAAHGVSRGLDANRMAAIGNAIVPQIAQWIAERIKEAEAQRTGVSLT
jgi:DNA (cytosine-5)-methyltransferase 1